MADDVLLISKRIDEAAAALIDIDQRPEDFVGVKTKVFLLELEREIAFIRSILHTPEQLKSTILKRCQQRDLDCNSDATIRIQELPHSSTNALYWDLITILFAPKTMGEMLRLLMPSINQHLEIAIPDQLPHKMTSKELRHYRLNFQPEIIVHHDITQSLTMAPDFELLIQLIFSDNTLVDVNDIVNYPLGAHAKLKSALEQSHPNVAQKLYTHNYSLQTLTNDICIHNNNLQIAPKERIPQLISCFWANGHGNTGAGIAAEAAQEANYNFLAYISNLPEATQQSLKALKYEENKTLADILHNQSNKAYCVESLARDLTSFMLINQNHQALTERAPISLDEMQQLEVKYNYHAPSGENVLNCNKEILSPLIWAKSLVKEAIKDIEPQIFPDFLVLLSDFDPQYYDLLFQNIRLNYPEITLIALGLILRRNNFFNLEQKQSLSVALWNNYAKIGAQFSYFYWAFVIACDPFATIIALKNTSKDLLLYNLSALNKEKNTLLFSAVSQPEFFKEIIINIPMPLRMLAIKLKCRGTTLIEAALPYPESFCTLLRQYPYLQQINLMNKELPDGIVIDLICSKYMETFIPTFTLIDECDRLQFIQDHPTIIPYLLNSPIILQQTVALLPPNHKVGFCTIIDANLNTCLHQAAKIPEALEILIEILPAENRLDTLMALNMEGDSVLTLASTNAESLRVIQELTEINLNLISSPRQIHNDLNEAIDKLLIHARDLKPFDEGKSEVLFNLAKALKLKLNLFYLKVATEGLTQESLFQFQFEFCQLLHSKDSIMGEHRRKWKPILANMILVLFTFGLALIAIGFKTGMQLFQAKEEKKSLSINNCLFFAKTKSEQRVKDVEEVVDLTFSSASMPLVMS